MDNLPDNADLRVFLVVARHASFAAAAAQLQRSTAYVSKRVHILESTLGVKLLHRTTRRVSVTEEGERVFHWAQRVLDDLDQLVQEVAVTRAVPTGLLHVSSSFGFGRNVVGPMLSRLVRRYPALQVRLDVFDRLVDVAGEGFDLDVRIGDDIAPHLIARRLAQNHRILCAAPSYLAARGMPRTPGELAAHDCLPIKERDHPFGVWKLQAGSEECALKVTGPLSANNGEIVVRWAADGHGVILRSLWDVADMLRDGRLVQILPQWRQSANVWAVYPSRLGGSAKVRVCVEFLQQEFARFGGVDAAGHFPPGSGKAAISSLP